MKDRYGFEIEEHDFVIWVREMPEEAFFMEGRVRESNEDHLIIDYIVEARNLLVGPVRLNGDVIKVTSPTVEERLKEKFWAVDPEPKPWETNLDKLVEQAQELDMGYDG